MSQADMNEILLPNQQGGEGRTAVPDWAALIIEGIEEVLFSVDTDWRFTYLNHRAVSVFGRAKEALLGNVIWELFPSLIGSKFEQFYRQAMASGKPGRLEEFSPTMQAWYEIRTYPIAHGLIIYFQDINVRKHAETEIQRQAERARVQAEVSRALATLTHDYHSTLDIAAQRLCELIGDTCIIRLISQDGQWFELTAWHHPDPEAAAFVRDILVGNQHQRVTEGLAGHAVQTGQPVLIPVISSEQLRATSDPKHWAYLDRFTVSSVLIAPLRATGRVIGIIAMNRNAPGRPYTNDDQILLQDLSDRVAIAIMNARLLEQVQSELAERVKTEAALRMSEERFKVLSEAAYEALLMHENGIVIEANQRAVEMSGYTLDELIGMPIEQLVAPESLTTMREGLARNSEYMGESVALRKDGTRLIVESRGKVIDYYGRRIRLVAIRDITELKQAEATLQKTQAQLLQSQKMESMGQLAGGIAHDFNNLLSVIIGYCGMLLVGLPETDPLYNDLLEIERAGKRAATLVRQILAFSRQQILEPQMMNLNEIVANLDKMLHRVLGEDIELVSMLDPHLASVMVDPGQIEQVIVNLAVNARDAMPDGGKLTIETTQIELDEQYRAAGHPEVRAGSYILLAVSDTGIGMEQAMQEKIFEPFFTTKAPGKGTGLGLATVYGIVRQSEGYIWVYSEPGVGTTFKICIPTSVDLSRVSSQVLPAQHPSASSSAQESAGKGRAILVVEDDAFVRELIYRVLSQAGYTLLQAHNGQAALDVLATYSGHIDVVLTDMVMPQMGGQVLVERLKQQWAHLKVLCMSGYTDQAVRRHKIVGSCDAFLQKPFTPKVLLQQLDELLNSSDV